jgi:uncharacterized membrane protein YhaH (DUF805 family)
MSRPAGLSTRPDTQAGAGMEYCPAMSMPPAALLSPPPALEPWALFVSLQGRVSRQTFWLYGVLAMLGLNLVLIALLQIAGVRSDLSEGIANLLLAWPTIAISVKRWHDRGHSGWWVLVALIPVIGWLWMLVANGFLPGTPGPNRFGEDPLGRPAP